MSWPALVAVLAAIIGHPLADELSRLEGHKVETTATSYAIRDVAGEGAPLVGVVRREGTRLLLEVGDERIELRGPLAVPRIAGPGYKVWVLGHRTSSGALTVRRIGVLRSPHR